METMTDLLGFGMPIISIAFPCFIIYLKLMKLISHRPIANGLDINKETVRS